MAAADLSTPILHPLTEALCGAGFALVTNVEARRGWGDVAVVTVHSGVTPADASPSLPHTIQAVVANALEGRRHRVEIRWAAL